MELSIVIPVYNEEENVEPLIQEINAAVGPLGKPYEIVVVDDGSRDATFTVLARLHRAGAAVSGWSGSSAILVRRPPLRRVSLMLAVTWSFSWTVTRRMIQRIFPRCLAELKKGNDLVCGWRSNRRDPFLHRRLPSLIANRLISWTTQVKLHDYGCTLESDAPRCRQKLEALRRNASIYSRHCL